MAVGFCISFFHTPVTQVSPLHLTYICGSLGTDNPLGANCAPARLSAQPLLSPIPVITLLQGHSPSGVTENTVLSSAWQTP